MALTYNNVDPTTINYKGTDITVVKYGDTTVWGKHYTLSISAGSNTSITVNRTSSPNQHASTGNLSNGSTIYYGDTLTISYTVSSGYNISTHTVNGTTFTSGTSYTVSSNISVITTAVASTSWHTVWSGSKQVTGISHTHSPINKSVTGFSGLVTGVSLSNIKITIGNIQMYDADYDEYYSGTPSEITIYGNQYLESQWNLFTTTNTDPGSSSNWCYIKLDSITNSTSLIFKIKPGQGGTAFINSFYIKKIEEYY